MKNAPHVIILLGKIFSLIGMIGTLLMLIAFVVLPPQYKLKVLSASAFPVFLILGMVLFFLGRRGVADDSKIRSMGVKKQGKLTRILAYGSRPVSVNSIYGAEVELDIDGERILSQVFFYGTDFAKVEHLIAERQSVVVLFLSGYPKRVLFAEV